MEGEDLSGRKFRSARMIVWTFHGAKKNSPEINLLRMTFRQNDEIKVPENFSAYIYSMQNFNISWLKPSMHHSVSNTRKGRVWLGRG